MGRPKKPLISGTCPVCKQRFYMPAYKPKINCSVACARIACRGIKRPGVGGQRRMSPTEQTCEICKTVFPITAQQASDNIKTCSGPCRNELVSRRKGGLGVTKCESCGEIYKVSRFHIKNGRRFCGDTCRLGWFSKQSASGKASNLWKHGRGIQGYGPSWPGARKAVLARDKKTCRGCGATREELGQNPDVHHIDPFANFGIERHEEANHPYNLICFCRSCHMYVHWAESRYAKMADS